MKNELTRGVLQGQKQHSNLADQQQDSSDKTDCFPPLYWSQHTGETENIGTLTKHFILQIK